MKKRLKGLACWWLVLIMLFSTLATPAMALPSNSIYIYAGTEPLKANDELDPYVLEGVSEGRQLSSLVPLGDGVTLTGWNLWEFDNINSGFVVTNKLRTEGADWALSSDEVETYATGAYYAFEPLYAYSANIDVYTGTDILEWYARLDPSDMEEKQITLNSPLNEQTSLSDRVTANLIGWKLWENDSSGLIRPEFYEADGTLSESDINSKSLLEAAYATAGVARNSEPLKGVGEAGFDYEGADWAEYISLDLGTPLNEQSAVLGALVPPAGEELVGWKLWRDYGSSGFVAYVEDISPKEVPIDYKVTYEDVTTIGEFDTEYNIILEPQWMLQHKIDPQPTSDVPTVGVKEYNVENDVWTDITDDPELRYQWYKESIGSYYLDNSHTGLVSGIEAEYSSNGIWYLTQTFEESWPVELFLDQGITVRVEPVGPTKISNISLNGHNFENNGEYWELTLPKSVDTYLIVEYNNKPTNEDGVKIYITEKSLSDTIDGENKKTLTAGEDGTYVCKVTLPNGYVLISDAVDYAPPAHTHNYTYTASDSVIYESCSCGHSQTAEVMAPTGTIIYDSTEKKGATVSYSDDWKGGELTVNYSNNVDAGTATASITKDGETASVTFTIAKATIDSVAFDVAAPEALADKQTTVENGTGYTAAISWDISDVKFGFNTAYTATVTLTADSNHKFADSIGKDGWTKTADGNVLTFTKTFDKTRIGKLTNLTNAPENKTLVGYHASVSEAIAELPTTVTYETELGDKTADIEWACANYNSVPAQTNIFAWSVKDGELSDYNTNGIAVSGSITVTNVAAISVTHSKTDKEITYNGSSYNVSQMFTKGTTTGTVSYEIVAGGTGAGTLSGTNLTITKAGTIDIKMSTAANAQYAAGDITATLTVNKADGVGSVEINDWIYGDTANPPQIASATNGIENAAYLYESTDDKDYSDSNAPQNAGAYKVTVTFAETDLYEEATASASFTIEKRVLTPSVSGTVSKIYDGTSDIPTGHTLTIALANKVGSDDVDANATFVYGGVNVGTTAVNATEITLTGTKSENYELSTNTATANVGEITPADMSTEIAADGYIGDYDNQDHTISVTLSGVADGATVKYGTADGTYDLDTAPAYTDEGTYTIYYKVEKANYNGVTGSADVVINKKDITNAEITLGDALTYNGTSQEQTIESATIDGLTITYDVSGDVNTNAGDYILTIEGNGNFSGNVQKSYTIAKKNIEGATVGEFTQLTYTGEAQTPTATVTVDELTATGAWSDVTNVADTSTFTANGNFTGNIENVNVGMSKASQDAPETPVAVNETIKAKADGKLTGVTSEMEYKLEGASEYTAISETEITNLAAGTYLVRYKEKPNYLASAEKQVVIADGALITISFNSSEGTEVESKTCEYNQAITAPAEPTKDGFVFAGWYKDEECLNSWNFSNTMTEDTILYAKWNDKPVYSISGKVTDGEYGLSGIAVTLKQGNTIIATTTTAADGSYSFITEEGLYNIVAEKEENDGSTIKTVKIEVTESANANDVVFVATDINSELEIKPDTPQIIVGGLDEEAQIVSSNNENADVTVKMTVESKEDITGSDDVQGQEQRQNEQKEIKKVSGNRYIQFIEINLTQSISGAESTKLEETSGLIEIIIPFEKGNKRNITVYRYHGSASEKLGAGIGNANADGEYFEVKENHIVVYAKKFSTYAIGYDLPSSGGGGSSVTRCTVKFDTNGGSSVSSATVTKNAKVAEPKTPEKEGYTFNGWYIDEELTEKYDFESKVTKNFTLYAKWDKHDDEQSSTDTHNCPSLAFDDLDITKWYHFDTDYVIENGIFKGTTETTFEPDSAQTRAMMVTVLYRVEGEPAVNRSIPFADVDMGAYYANAVIWGQQNGIIKGYSETEFGPDDKITREQIAAIMHRYAQYKGYDVSVGENTNILSYDDFDSISEYAIPSMQWAVGSGLIKGKSESTLNPLDNATRAEIAAILHRFIEANK